LLQSGGITRCARRDDTLAPFHLLHQEVRRHRGVALLAGVEALEAQQVARALERIAQRPVGLVRPRRPLHRDAPLGLGGGGEAVRVDMPLQLAIALLQATGINRVGGRDA